MKTSFTDADLLRAELRAKYERKGSLTQSRILPKSTADVHAAIAAVKARSTPSSGHETTYSDWSEVTKNLVRIDRVLNNNKTGDNFHDESGERNHQTRDDFDVTESDSDISSDLTSDDSSVETEDSIPTATRLNLAAYIDSLKSGHKWTSEVKLNQSDTNDTKKIVLETNDDSHLRNSVHTKDVIDRIEKRTSDYGRTTETAPKEHVSSFHDADVQECVRKAALLAEDVDCSVDDINRIVMFARGNRYPTRLLLNAFCETRAEIGYNPKSDNVTIYCELVGKAIDIVELGHHNFRRTVSSLISNVRMNNFDESLIRNIIDHPDDHVRDRGNDITPFSSDYHDEFGLQEDSFDASSTNSGKIDYLDQKLNQLSNAERLSRMENTDKVPRMSAVSVARKLRNSKALKSQPSIVDFKCRSFKLSIHERLALHPGFENVDSITETVLSQPFFNKENLTPVMYDDYFDWKDVPISHFTNRKILTEFNWFGKKF